MQRNTYFLPTCNNGQINLTKDDIARLIMTYTQHINIFYHIRQVAAHVAKLFLDGIVGPHFGRKGGRRDQQWYHSKERRQFPIGSVSVITIALSVTIQLQFAIEYLRCSNQHGVVHFGAKSGEEDVMLQCSQVGWICSLGHFLSVVGVLRQALRWHDLPRQLVWRCDQMSLNPLCTTRSNDRSLFHTAETC